MSAPPLRGQVVLITGAGSGIGAATAHELHKRGAVPVLLDIDEAGLAATRRLLGGTPLALQVDVGDADACRHAVQETLRVHGRLDIAWANAGIAAFGPLAHGDPAAFARCLHVNVNGVFNTVHAALPALLRSRGYVAATASVASFAHAPFMSAYAASKAAVEALCNSWRIELAAHGVDVGCIHAHWVSTALVAEGSLHPAFERLRRTMPAILNHETPAAVAAARIADGLARRARRIWVPGWVRALHALRALLHSRVAERELLRAAPEMEALYLQGVAAEGTLASSFGPREREREAVRRRGVSTPMAK
jgi:NAD(P)-dependent dehydrogenase (short-subunit alcohol dehydrogenase family)